MNNKEITLQTILDVMNSRFEKVDKRLDGIDDRLDNMDIRITRMELLFDANQATSDRMDLFRNQQLRFAEQLEKFSYRLGSVEKLVFQKN